MLSLALRLLGSILLVLLLAPDLAAQWLVDEQVVHPRTRSGPGERYAWNVATVNDSTVLVSSLGERDQANEGTTQSGETVGLGAVLVYRKQPDGTWRTRDTLFPVDFPDPIQRAPDFGFFTDAFGDDVIVGAPNEEGQQYGAAYIFERDPTTDAWDRCARLPNPRSPGTAPELPNSERAQRFGIRVAINGEFAAVASRGFDRIGAVFVYQRTGRTCSETDWELIQIISRDLFPYETTTNRSGLQLLGDQLFIGRPFSSAAGEKNGAVHILIWDGSTRSFRPDFGSPLLPDVDSRETYFGEDLDFNGEVLAVGAEGYVENGVNVGATYIFRQAGNSWTSTPEALLFSDDPQERYEFGKQVEFSGPLLLVGENGRDAGPGKENEETGVIHVFEPTGSGGWQRADVSLFAPDDLARGANFGEEIAATPALVVVGAPENFLTSDEREGAAYAYSVIQGPPPSPVLGAPSPDSVGVQADAPLTLRWEAAQTAEAYRLEIAEDDGFATLVTDADGLSDTAYDLTAGTLAAGTPYFWRVAATNVAGASVSSTNRFVTNVAAPVLATPDDQATGVALTPTLGWEAVFGAERYEVTVATDPDFAGLVVEPTLLDALSYAVPEEVLGSGQTYHWRVRAQHADDPTVYSPLSVPRTFQTVFAAPALLTNAVAFPDDSDVTLRWESLPTASTYRVQWGTDPTFAEVEARETVSETAYAVPSPQASRSRYFWRVAADEPGASDDALVWNGSSFVVYASTVSATLDVAFGDPEVATAYRLLALPGAETIPLAALFEGAYGQTWRAFDDDGSEDDGGSGFLVEYAPSAPFSFAPGKSYWVLGATPATYTDTDARAVALTAGSYAYEVPVRPGWNLIASPYPFPVAWAQVQAATPWPVGDALYAYTGDFRRATTLQPSQGYYLFVNDPSPGSLVVPYLDADPAVLAEEPTPVVRLHLRQGTVERALELAADPAASRGLDALDRAAAPGVFAPLSAGFLASDEASASRLRLQRETRASVEAGTRTVLHAQTSVDLPTLLTLDAAHLAEGVVVALVPETGRPVILEPGVPVPLALRRDTPVRLDVVIDRPEALAALGGRPTVLALHPPHPNPVTAQATIQFALPEAAHARLAVYDLRGRLALVLHDGYLTPGQHRVPATLTSLASGTYFVRVEALGQTRTRPLTLVGR